jgi:hypothetical protein
MGVSLLLWLIRAMVIQTDSSVIVQLSMTCEKNELAARAFLEVQGAGGYLDPGEGSLNEQIDVCSIERGQSNPAGLRRVCRLEPAPGTLADVS